MHRKPGQKAPNARANGLRRRVIFEMTPEQLPILEEAERRHGSKRAALLAALVAEAEVEELRAGESKARAKTAKTATKAEQALTDAKAIAKLERELAATEKALAERERELAGAREKAESSNESWATGRVELQEALADRDEELADLADRVTDELYCGHCGEWAAPEQWAWETVKEKGSYAYHRSCGDCGPGLMSTPSWLARRHL